MHDKIAVITGANSGVGLVTARRLAELGVSGRFFLRSREHTTRRITYDTTVAARLWNASERLTGVSA